MFKKIDKWFEARHSINNLEAHERFLMMLQKHNTSVEQALVIIRNELAKEGRQLCDISA